MTPSACEMRHREQYDRRDPDIRKRHATEERHIIPSIERRDPATRSSDAIQPLDRPAALSRQPAYSRTAAVENTSDRLRPNAVIEPMIATAINPASNPYSSAVTPRRSRQSALTQSARIGIVTLHTPSRQQRRPAYRVAPCHNAVTVSHRQVKETLMPRLTASRRYPPSRYAARISGRVSNSLPLPCIVTAPRTST